MTNQQQSQETDQEIPFIQSHVQEFMALEKAKLHRISIAKDQKAQMNYKYTKEQQEKLSDFEYGVLENKKLSLELKATKEAMIKKSLQQKANWKKELDHIIADKESLKNQERLQSEELEKTNARFEKRKTTINKKHKEYVKDLFKEKDSVYDLISNLAYEENKQKEAHIEEFIQKGVDAHVNDSTDRIERESKLKEELKRDMLSVQEILVKKAKERIEKEKSETFKYKKIIQDQDEAHVLAKQRDLETKKLAITECKKEQFEQMVMMYYI